MGLFFLAVVTVFLTILRLGVLPFVVVTLIAIIPWILLDFLWFSTL